MAELERRLRDLGAALDVPRAPALIPGVLDRLPARRARRTRFTRRTLALAFVAVLFVVGGAFAVPPVRHAILRVLGLRGATIERVPRLPSPPPGGGTPLQLGDRIPIARARHAASFTALLPPHPTAAYVGHDVPGGRISLKVGPVLLIEFRATATPYVLKLIGPGTTAQTVRVNGGPGVYLSGAPHEVYYRDPTGAFRPDRVRLAGNVLLWQQGPLTIRVEGVHSLTQALALAQSLR